MYKKLESESTMEKLKSKTTKMFKILNHKKYQKFNDKENEPEKSKQFPSENPKKFKNIVKQPLLLEQ